MKPPPGKTVGLVLAGGRGRRMGGADKGLVRYRGRPLAAHAVAALRPSTDFVVLSANRNFARYGAIGDRVQRDLRPDHRGPLAGIQACMRAVRVRWLLVCPCDMPRLSPAIPARLLRALRVSGGADVAVLHDGERLQPLIAAWRGTLAPALGRYLDGGGRSAHGFLAERRTIAVRMARIHDPAPNVNLVSDTFR